MSTSGIAVGREDAWKVGALAQATGLTVRALHYYDHIGLLSPSMRTAAGPGPGRSPGRRATVRHA